MADEDGKLAEPAFLLEALPTVEGRAPRRNAS